MHRSGRLLVVQHGSVGDADDQAILREEPGHRLPPRLGTGRMQHLETRALKLAASRCDSIRIRYLKLDRRLRNHPVGGPLRRAKTRLRGLREGPHTEVLTAGDVPAGVIAVACALQWQPQGAHEQLAALRRVSGDNRHARDEKNVHAAQPTGCSWLGRKPERFKEPRYPALLTRT